jgi:plasmid stabilization system protein ParE
MSREIRKKPQAERDIEECFVFIGEDNLDIAVHFLVAVEDSIELISKNPFVGLVKIPLSEKFGNLKISK